MIDKDGNEERRTLELVIAGKAKPTLGHAATLGRLAELYLSGPDRAARAPAALELLRIAPTVEHITSSHRLYPKLRHFEAMAMRLVDPALAEKAAELDEEAWRIALENAPGEAILFASQWGDWAWDNDKFKEAGLAYLNAHRALRRFILRQVEDRDRLDVQRYTTYATRGAFALAETNDPEQALILLERACDLVFGASADRHASRRLRELHPDLGARLDAAVAETNLHTRSRDEKFGLDEFGNLSPAARAAQSALDAIVAEVRKQPGFSNFALPSNKSDIVAAAQNTSLVYVAPTPKGTLLCAVRGDNATGARVAHLCLPTTTADIARAATPFIDAEYGVPRRD